MTDDSRTLDEAMGMRPDEIAQLRAKVERLTFVLPSGVCVECGHPRVSILRPTFCHTCMKDTELVTR